MIRKILLQLICLAFILTALPVSPVMADEYSDLIEQGDNAYMLRENMAKTKQAMESYEKAVSLAPDRPGAHWRLSRALYWVGSNMPWGKGRLPVYAKAVEHGRIAVKVAPNSADAQYWYGVSLGLHARTKGSIASLNSVDSIKKAMNEVIRIDPGYDSGGAYTVLGRLYFSLPGAFGGSNKKSMEHLTKAVKLGPNRQLTRIYLAELHLDEGRADKALAEVNLAISSPCEKLAEPECRQWKKRAKKLLRKIEKEAK